MRLILRHGDELGHDWKPKDMAAVFDSQKSEFTFDQNFDSHHDHHRRGLKLEGFIASVVNHMHARHDLGLKVKKASGNVERIDCHELNIPLAERITYYDKWVNCLISLLYMMYPSLCTSSFALIGCHSVGEINQYLQRDMEYQCWTSNHMVWVFLIFAPSFLVFVIGLPLMSVWILQRNRAMLYTNKRIKFQLSILCVGYRQHVCWWESVVSLRKGFIVGISIFLLSVGPKLQTLAAQLLIGLLLVLHTNYQPYVQVASRHDPLNHGEFFGLTAAFVTLTCGMYLFHYGSTSTGSFKITVSVVIILINVMFFINSIRVYAMLYLVDLEMELDRTKNKDVGNYVVAFCLQRCLPDWREESHNDLIASANEHKIRVAQFMSVDRLSRLKGFAKKWVVRTRASMESKKVDAIERNSDLSRIAFQSKLKTRLMQAHSRVQMRKLSRLESKGGKKGGGVKVVDASQGGGEVKS